MSTVLARRAAGGEFDASYWGRNMRQPVRFAESVSLLLEQGAPVFVELSPHPILTQAIQETHKLAVGTQSLRSNAAAVKHPSTDRAGGGRALVDRRRPFQLGAANVDQGARSIATVPVARDHWVRQAEQRSPAQAVVDEVTVESQRAWLHTLQWRSIDLPDVPAVTDPRRWLVVGSSELAAAG